MLSGQQTTNVNDLTNALKKKAPHIKQKVQVAKSSKKLLSKPLDKVHAEKVIFLTIKNWLLNKLIKNVYMSHFNYFIFDYLTVNFSLKY